MKEAIDLYAKIVVATFSFIGPSFTLLIALFVPAIKRSTNRHAARMNTLQEILTKNIENNTDFAQLVRTGKTELDKLSKGNNKEIRLLNPKRQVRRLAISLAGSIFGIEFYYFQHSHFWQRDVGSYKAGSIILSVGCFVYCVNVLWQLFCTIIRIKTEDEMSKHEKVQPANNNLSTNETP